MHYWNSFKELPKKFRFCDLFKVFHYLISILELCFNILQNWKVLTKVWSFSWPDLPAGCTAALFERKDCVIWLWVCCLHKATLGTEKGRLWFLGHLIFHKLSITIIIIQFKFEVQIEIIYTGYKCRLWFNFA